MKNQPYYQTFIKLVDVLREHPDFRECIQRSKPDAKSIVQNVEKVVQRRNSDGEFFPGVSLSHHSVKETAHTDETDEVVWLIPG